MGHAAGLNVTFSSANLAPEQHTQFLELVFRDYGQSVTVWLGKHHTKMHASQGGAVPEDCPCRCCCISAASTDSQPDCQAASLWQNRPWYCLFKKWTPRDVPPCTRWQRDQYQVRPAWQRGRPAG